MFKKISLLAVGSNAAFDGTSKDTTLCAAVSGTDYADGVNCHAATIKIEGKAPPADNTVTDGYQATMSVGFLAMNLTANNLGVGVCVIPVALTGADDSAYNKAPRGMCIGAVTHTGSTGAKASFAAAKNQYNGFPGWFGHIATKDIVAQSGADAVARKETCPDDDTKLEAQVGSTQIPVGITSLKDNVVYGTITLTPASADFFKQVVTATGLYSWTNAALAKTVPARSAVFMMPTQADTYADVPRLSPADLVTWQAYAPNVGSATVPGKLLAQGSAISNATLIDNFATTVAAGVAMFGAAALSF